MITREKSKLEKVLDIIQKEPNYETFVYRGYKCVIKRMMILGGQLNGYVRILETSKFYQKGYDDIPIECHGGLTFTGDIEDDGDFYIGFDTAHWLDYMPFMQFQLPVSMRSMDYPDVTYKDINYLRKECKSIVDQLVVLERDANNTETS